MNIELIRYSLLASLIFSVLLFMKDSSNAVVSDPWFIPVIAAVLWISYK
jgi:hypothetical protein